MAKPKPKPKTAPRSPPKKSAREAKKPAKKPAPPAAKGKRAYHSPSEEEEPVAGPSRRPPKKKTKSAAVSEADSSAPDSPMEIDEPGGNIDDDDTDDDDVIILPDANVPAKIVTRARADDIDLMFDPVEQVIFKGLNNGHPLKGRFCKTCKSDKVLVKKHSLKKAFLVGSNATLRYHCKQHWVLYKKRCEENDVVIRIQAMPPLVVKQMEADAAAEEDEALGRKKQPTLAEMGMVVSNRPKAFNVATVLEHVSKYICSTDASLATADNVKFRNVLVAMRPNTRSSELPTAYKVSTYIHNEFVDMLEEDKQSIKAAIGVIAMTADTWSATKASRKTSYLGATASWTVIVVRKKRRPLWRIKSTIVGFKALEGTHSGLNIGRFFFSLCIRGGIIDVDRKISKLGDVTLDNAANNGTLCVALEKLHDALKLQKWDAVARQLMCLAHILNLGILAVMNKVTSIAAVETTTAIWEYDPKDPFNRVLGGSLDVIAAIRTLAVKIQASGQRIEYFHQLQAECDFVRPLSITLHGNTRWGTAHGMMDRALQLKKPINRFIVSADERFGDITVIRTHGKTTKKLKWSAFKLNEDDWRRVEDCRDILEDPNSIQHLFSSDNVPTIYQVLPAFETLLSLWEKKLKNERFAPYHEALEAGLAKFRKYYDQFDKKDAYVLAMFIHPFYKLHWVFLNWGGAKEQQKEILEGNANAKDWHKESEKIVEAAMAKYWPIRLTAEQVGGDDSSDDEADDEDEDGEDDEDNSRAGFVSPPPSSSPGPSSAAQSEKDDSDEDLGPDELYAKKRAALIKDQRPGFNGWSAELRSWLKHIPRNVTKETDLCKYWAKHSHTYPTIARIAVDYMPSHATAVPCERMFSSSGETADHLRSQIGTAKFEELQMMKKVWRDDKTDFARLNEDDVTVLDIAPFTKLLEQDETNDELERIGAVLDELDFEPVV